MAWTNLLENLVHSGPTKFIASLFFIRGKKPLSTIKTPKNMEEKHVKITTSFHKQSFLENGGKNEFFSLDFFQTPKTHLSNQTAYVGVVVGYCGVVVGIFRGNNSQECSRHV